MYESMSSLFEQLRDHVSQLTWSELLLRIALIGCSLFAMIQLMTMMGTRYGDKNASVKSFYLSLLLHCCFGLGWATVVQSYPPQSPTTSENVERPEIQVTFANETESPEESGSGQVPVWINQAEADQPDRSRVDRAANEPEPPEELVVEKSPEKPPIPAELPDLNSSVEEVPVTPVPETVADSNSRTPVPPTMTIDSPKTEARRDVGGNVPAMRQTLSRETVNSEPTLSVEPQRRQPKEIGPVIDSPTSPFTANVDPDSQTPKLAPGPDESIRPKTGPKTVAPLVALDDRDSSSSSLSDPQQPGRFTRKTNPSKIDRPDDAEGEPIPPRTARSTKSRSETDEDRLLASRNAVPTGPTTDRPTPDFVRPDTPSVPGRANKRSPEAYRARRNEQRRSMALKNGGSAASERAVEMSLKWMASVQEQDGRWSSSRHGGGAAKKDPQGQDRDGGGLYADTGVTGLMVLSFLGAGYTHEEGKYSDNVNRAIRWLIDQQQSNGFLGGDATQYDRMYCHAIATFALAEAYGMQQDPGSFPELRDSVRLGIRLINAMQNEDGGWRYGKGMESDMSMFGWQLMALKSAVNGGVAVPEETRRGMAKFLQARALGNEGGLAGYKLGERPTPAMTAEALFCRQMFNVRPSNAASQESVNYLRRNLPKLSAYDEYYWYYGTLAMFQTDGPAWEEWNSSLRDTLIDLQRTSGPNAGSWDPKGKWSGIGGRLYSTALSTMCLEVYYRFLRIYQQNEDK